MEYIHIKNNENQNMDVNGWRSTMVNITEEKRIPKAEVKLNESN